MKVKIFDHAAETHIETYRATADLRDCLPDDEEYEVARHELNVVGRYWIGGGAAPLVLLLRA